MSIGKRVSKAVLEMEAGDFEDALFQICSPIDFTAQKETNRRGRSVYKGFIHQNMRLISQIAFFRGSAFQALNVNFDHPGIKKNSQGLVSVEAVLYHAVRCGLYHECNLPANLSFSKTNGIVCDNGSLTLPGSLVYGLVIAVVVSPVNRNEQCPTHAMLHLGDLAIPINSLWGRRKELSWLLQADAEARNLQSIAKSSKDAEDG